jgi:hypothetical protein
MNVRIGGFICRLALVPMNMMDNLVMTVAHTIIANMAIWGRVLVWST